MFVFGGGIKFTTGCPSVRPFVSRITLILQQDYANTTRPIILKKFNSKGIYVT